jgi:hypothetical protein
LEVFVDVIDSCASPLESDLGPSGLRYWHA